MAPPQTLKETMRAAGNPRLTEWHSHLVNKGNEKKVLDEKVAGDIIRRDQIQSQVDNLAPDVEHFENRQNQELQVSGVMAWREAQLTRCVEGDHGACCPVCESYRA